MRDRRRRGRSEPWIAMSPPVPGVERRRLRAVRWAVAPIRSIDEGLEVDRTELLEVMGGFDDGDEILSCAGELLAECTRFIECARLELVAEADGARRSELVSEIARLEQRGRTALLAVVMQPIERPHA